MVARAAAVSCAVSELAPPAERTANRGKDHVTPQLKPGDKLHGFTVIAVEEVKDFNVTAFQLVHDKTGAKYLHADCDDSNNTFNVAFRTTPTDSTGVAHVLEHTVLCGSQKYPVRDPFFNMLKRSLNTFMNAMTAPDYTMYPFSTRNATDYYNLLSVYLDAAFFPNITAEDFRQEGHRLELKDPEDSNSPLVFAGVVFNEMKGAMSSADSQFTRRLSSEVFPTSTYHHNSGGDPKNIPELTHKQLVDFHATHYHPSNACIFSYGDLPLEETLQRVDAWALVKFDRLDVSNLDVTDEIRLTEPKKLVVQGPTDAVVTNPDKQSIIAVSYLLNNKVDNEFEVFKLQLAGELLTSGPTAPFYKSLIEPMYGSGFAPGTGYSSQRREATFAVGLKGVADADADTIQQAVLDTFAKVAQEGFTAKRVESVLHQIELSTRSVTTSFGLSMSFSIMSTFLHGGDPLAGLRINAMVERLRAEMAADPEFWQKVIRERFVENKHRVTLHMTPDAEFNARLEAAEAARLVELEKGMTAEMKEEVKELAQQLKASQDRPQPVDKLPTLLVEDIPSKMERVESVLKAVAGTPVQWDDQPTNGIVYVNMVYDTAELPAHLRPYLPLFCSLLTSLGTADMDFQQLAEAIKSSTGGVSAQILTYTTKDDLNEHTLELDIGSQCLNRNLPAMFSLLEALAVPCGVRWHDEPDRMKELLTRRAAALSSAVAPQGLSFALAHAKGRLTPESASANKDSGLPHVVFMQGLVGAGADPAALQPQGAVPTALEEIAMYLWGAPGGAPSRLLRCRVAGEAEQFAQVEQLLAGMMSKQGARLSAREQKEVAAAFEVKGGRTFFAVPSQTNYVAQAFRTVPYTHEDAAALLLLGQALSTCFLHREIREKGGAYGGGAAASVQGGTFSFTSYRDPRTLETLDTFQAAAKWAAADGSFSERDLAEAKLRAFKSLDAPVAPSGKGFSLFWSRLDDDVRQAFRTRVLAVRTEDLARVAGTYLLGDAAEANMAVAIVGNQDKVTLTHGQDGWQVLDASMKPLVVPTPVASA